MSEPILFSRKEWFFRDTTSELFLIFKIYILLPVIIIFFLILITNQSWIIFLITTSLWLFPLMLIFIWEYYKMMKGMNVPGLYNDGIVIPKDSLFIPYKDIDTIEFYKKYIYIHINIEERDNYSNDEFRFTRSHVLTPRGVALLQKKISQ